MTKRRLRKLALRKLARNPANVKAAALLARSK